MSRRNFVAFRHTHSKEDVVTKTLKMVGLLTVAVALNSCGLLMEQQVDNFDVLLGNYPKYVQPVDNAEGLSKEQAAHRHVMLQVIRADLPYADAGLIWRNVYAKQDRIYLEFEIANKEFLNNALVMGMDRANQLLYQQALKDGVHCAETLHELNERHAAGIEVAHADFVYKGRIIAHYTVELVDYLCDTEAPVYY